MSFQRDWLRAYERQRITRIPPGLNPAVRFEINVFEHLARRLRTATTVRLRGDQAQVFLDTPAVEGQDYVKWLRLPYPAMFIALEAPLRFTGYLSEDNAQALYEMFEREVDAERLLAQADETFARAQRVIEQGTAQPPSLLQAIIVELQTLQSALTYLHAKREDVQKRLDEMKASLSPSLLEYAGLLRPPGSDPAVKGILLLESERTDIVIGGVECEAHAPFARVLQVVFFMPDHQDFLSCHIATVGVCVDNTLTTSKHGFWQTRAKMIGWAIHLINFLSSPSVKLVHNEPPKELQRARQRRGQEPLPGWYEITYRKHVQEYTKSKMSTKKWEHSFRYDVRGHFKRFERGPMAGRVIWCPPHQRGLKHELYRPKGYRTE